MNIEYIFSLLATIFGGLGVAYAFFRVGKAKTIIDLLTDENAVLTASRSRLEQDNAAKDALLKSKDEQIKALEGLAHGTPQLTRLTSAVARMTRELTKLTSAVMGGMNK